MICDLFLGMIAKTRPKLLLAIVLTFAPSRQGNRYNAQWVKTGLEIIENNHLPVNNEFI